MFATLVCAGVLLHGPNAASAHDMGIHGDHMDTQMKKLHAMMPVFSVASAELESAINKGDADAAKVQADRILAAVPDLKKSKPHKHVKERKKFVELATKLGKIVTLTTDQAKMDNFAEAKASFKKVEEICAACHAKFRD